MYISRIICPSANGTENAAKAAGAIGPCGFRRCGTTLRPHHIPTSTIIYNLLTYVLLRHPPPMGTARSQADSCSQAHVQSVQMFHVKHPHASTDLRRRAAKKKARRCRGNEGAPLPGKRPPPRARYREKAADARRFRGFRPVSGIGGERPARPSRNEARCRLDEFRGGGFVRNSCPPRRRAIAGMFHVKHLYGFCVRALRDAAGARKRHPTFSPSARSRCRR